MRVKEEPEVSLEREVHLVCLASQERGENLGHLDQKDHQESKVQKELLVIRVQQVLLDCLVREVSLDLMVLKETEEIWDLQVLRVKVENKEKEGLKV